VILEAWAPDFAACCEEAVAALVDTYVDAAEVEVVERRRIDLAPASPEALLFDLLEEVIFTLDTAGGVPVRAEATATAGGGLAVVLVLADRRRVAGTGALPKAISRSDFGVFSNTEAVSCRFLVDV
jgi:SHS2 domain-containing protein